MVSPKPVFWALQLALLGSVLGWARLHSCSVPDILHHYRAVIFEDLHAALRQAQPEARRRGSSRHHFIWKNLTGDVKRLGWPEVSCGAQEEHSILLSIKSLGRTLRGAVSGDRRGALEKAVWTVAIRTEAVMRRHCWTPRLSRQPRTRPARRHWRQGGQRRLLLRALDTVATCWEKLFALRARPTRKS